MAALVTVNVLDAHSSAGHYETNPQQGLEKTSAIVDFAAAGALGATAYRNSRVP